MFSEEEKDQIKKEFKGNIRLNRNANPELKLKETDRNTKEEASVTQQTEEDTIFTEHNIITTQNELLRNVSSKSVILAPFNSTNSHLSEMHSSVKDLLKKRGIFWI